MKPPSAAIRTLARRLLEREISPDAGAEDLAAGAATVHQKLWEHLYPIINSAGFDALFRRAVHMARRDYPLLEDVPANEARERWIGGLEEAARGREPDELREAVEETVARFLGLVAYFIGERLAVRMVSRAWPDLERENTEAAFEGEAE